MDKNTHKKTTGKRSIIFKALLKSNPILVSGMVVAPVVFFATNFSNAITLIISFSIITFFTLLFSSFIPHNIVYTIRIILYTLIGALVFVPTVIFLGEIMPEKIENMGIYFPILIANSFILSKSETMFYSDNKGYMILEIVFGILGYDAVVLIYAAIREIISVGEIGGNVVAFSTPIFGFTHTYGGFLLLGMIVALYRFIVICIKKFDSRGGNGK